MMFGQLAADEISDSGSAEGKQHFDETAAQQEGKTAAGERRRKAKSCRRVETVNPLDFIQMGMQLLCGHEFSFPLEVVDEMLQAVQPRRIDPGVGQTERLCVAMVSVKAGIFDG